VGGGRKQDVGRDREQIVYQSGAGGSESMGDKLEAKSGEDMAEMMLAGWHAAAEGQTVAEGAGHGGDDEQSCPKVPTVRESWS